MNCRAASGSGGERSSADKAHLRTCFLLLQQNSSSGSGGQLQGEVLAHGSEEVRLRVVGKKAANPRLKAIMVDFAAQLGITVLPASVEQIERCPAFKVAHEASG